MEQLTLKQPELQPDGSVEAKPSLASSQLMFYIHHEHLYCFPYRQNFFSASLERTAVQLWFSISFSVSAITHGVWCFWEEEPLIKSPCLPCIFLKEKSKQVLLYRENSWEELKRLLPKYGTILGRYFPPNFITEEFYTSKDIHEKTTITTASGQSISVGMVITELLQCIQTFESTEFGRSSGTGRPHPDNCAWVLVVPSFSSRQFMALIESAALKAGLHSVAVAAEDLCVLARHRRDLQEVYQSLQKPHNLRCIVAKCTGDQSEVSSFHISVSDNRICCVHRSAVRHSADSLFASHVNRLIREVIGEQAVAHIPDVEWHKFSQDSCLQMKVQMSSEGWFHLHISAKPVLQAIAQVGVEHFEQSLKKFPGVNYRRKVGQLLIERSFFHKRLLSVVVTYSSSIRQAIKEAGIVDCILLFGEFGNFTVLREHVEREFQMIGRVFCCDDKNFSAIVGGAMLASSRRFF